MGSWGATATSPRWQIPALWELGSDATRFAGEQLPGELLQEAATVHYVYNPDNCPEASLAWLRASGLTAHRLEHASHWPTVDAPDRLAALVLRILASGPG